MEALGAAASVLALAQVIGKIAKLLDKVGRAQEKWKQYHQELILIQTLVSTVDILWKEVEGPNGPTINVNGRQTSLIGYCQESI
ncbi:Ff.00g117530.m01.CDS01 [Fusarium sp. VM40]|nr:Ff.00g117530.m01.CDS01 [Fusarium sp. VM40]